nr:putative wall-associated receptor kinase-like 16 [Quercus suber]
MVLDWAIGNETCEVARNKGNYICGANSNCSDHNNGSGYRCNCKQGYEGNPYLKDGCRGAGIGLIVMFVCCSWLYLIIKQRNLIKLKRKVLQAKWIAIETAEALSYLHSAASTPIIHRDVKSSNILLDSSYTAKVSDFGASRLISLDQTEVATMVQGTIGYLDPEYLHTSQLTEKSDVYSFGVVLVELLTRRKALSFDKPEVERSLVTYFLLSLKENRLFEVLGKYIAKEGNAEQLKEVAILAKKCLKLKGEDRPTMKEVATELEGL